jgi:hypothetical protein
VLDVLDTAFADLDFFTNNRLFADVGLLFGERNTDRLIGNRRAVDSDIARDGLALDDEFFVTHGHVDRLHLRDDLFANACLTMLDALLVDDESLRPQLDLLVLVGRPNECRCGFIGRRNECLYGIVVGRLSECLGCRNECRCGIGGGNARLRGIVRCVTSGTFGATGSALLVGLTNISVSCFGEHDLLLDQFKSK